MITVENPLLLKGIPVFRDSADADLFWVLPGAPHLAATPLGDSSFTLFEYRNADGTGGGFAELEIELTTPGGASLAAAAGREGARLAAVPFRAGDVRLLTATGADSSLVEAVLGASAAPLVPPFHAVFALEVSEQGTALLAQAATLPTAPIGVVYQLRFLAQTPALHAHVTMDYDRVYEHFSAALGFTYYVSVRLDLELSWLVEHGLVTIEITQFTDQADQQRQQQAVLDLVRARIEADFFRSSLPATSDAAPLGGALGQLVGNQAGQNITSTTALFVLKARMDIEKELKRFEIFYDGHTVEELTHVVSGFVGTMAGDAAPVIRQITTTDPFFRTLDVKVIAAIDFDDVPDLREAVLTIGYGDQVQSYVATKETPGPFRFTCPLDPARRDYTARADFHFDPASPAGPATIASVESTRRDGAYVAGSGDAFTVVRVLVTGADSVVGLVLRLPVALRIVPNSGGPALAQDVLVVDGDHPQQAWYRRVPGPATGFRVLARADWEDRDGVVHQGAEVEVVGANFLARGPIVEQYPVLVQPAVDWTAVTQVAVELRHPVIGTVQDESVLFSAAAGTEPKGVTLALDDSRRRGYSWKATVLRADGTTGVSDWADSDTSVLLITDVGSKRAAVRVVWLGDAGTALAMQVDFWVTPPGAAEEQVASALLQPGHGDTTISWPDPDSAPLSYRYEVHRLDAAGDTIVHAGTDTSPLLVVRTSG